jgi:hypothetical protein
MLPVTAAIVVMAAMACRLSPFLLLAFFLPHISGIE